MRLHLNTPSLESRPLSLKAVRATRSREQPTTGGEPPGIAI